MTPEIKKEIDTLRLEVKKLMEWKNERERQQLRFPLDVASALAVGEGFKVAGIPNLTVQNLFVKTIGVYAGTGAPTFSAPQGSLYLRTDGASFTNRAYINAGSTTWKSIQTDS